MKFLEPHPLPNANEQVGNNSLAQGLMFSVGKGPAGASTDSASPAPRQKTKGSQKTQCRCFSPQQNEQQQRVPYI